MSAPPGPRGGISKLQTAALNNSRGGSHPSSPATTHGPSAAAQLRLGPRPELDETKVEELLNLSAGETLTLVCGKSHAHRSYRSNVVVAGL